MTQINIEEALKFEKTDRIVEDDDDVAGIKLPILLAIDVFLKLDVVD